jgi:hypothetical protein
MLLALEEINQENALLNEQFEATKLESNTKFQEMDEVERECEELEIEIARNNKLLPNGRKRRNSRDKPMISRMKLLRQHLPCKKLKPNTIR